ncbi:3577_t:CDS:2, partial [Entrophospora sp. SA101]
MKITKLRAKPKKLEQLGPCTPEVAALLTCWANNTMNSSACIQNVQALSNCMRNVPRKTKPPNTINYHLSRLVAINENREEKEKQVKVSNYENENEEKKK